MQVYPKRATLATGDFQSTQRNQAKSGSPTPDVLSALHRFSTRPTFSLRSRVWLALVGYSCERGPAYDWWTPAITSTDLAREFERSPKTLARLVLALVDEGNLERRVERLGRGGWAWAYRAIDIAAERLGPVVLATVRQDTGVSQ